MAFFESTQFLCLSLTIVLKKKFKKLGIILVIFGDFGYFQGFFSMELLEIG